MRLSKIGLKKLCNASLYPIKKSLTFNQSRSKAIVTWPPHTFPRFTPVAHFPRSISRFIFVFLRFHRLHVIPRSGSVACFPALRTGGMFSRAAHQLHVVPRFVSGLHVSVHFAPVAFFPRASHYFEFD